MQPQPIAQPFIDPPKLKSIVVIGLERHYYLDNGEVLTLEHPKVGKTGEYFVTRDDYGYLSKRHLANLDEREVVASFTK